MRLYITAKAQRDLGRLPNKLGIKLNAEIAKLAVNPFLVNSKKLRGRDDTYRIRVGDYRVIYEINKDTQELVITKIKHRKDVYR